jgi:hypothetical protein
MLKRLPHVLLIFLIAFLNAQSNFAQSNEECMSCHSDPDIYMEKNGRKVKLHVRKFELARSVHSKMLCINCHVGFKADDIPHKTGDMSVNCMVCHSNPKVRHPWHPSMVKATGSKGSPDVNCVGCHGSHTISSPSDENSPLHFTKSIDFCGNCHSDVKKDHLQSEHSIQYVAHNPNAPTCIYCHKQPITKGNKLSELELKLNQEKLCLSCHLHITSIASQYANSLINYEKSVHGRALLAGNNKAAMCVDCHGTHKLQKASHPDSRINHFNVHNICGTCHAEVTKEYMESVHGKSLKAGNKESPSCSYCHGEHDIQKVPDIPQVVFTKSGMNFNIVVNNRMVYCVSCHSNEEMMKKYGLATVDKAHNWLPRISSHWDRVRCVDCHSSIEPPYRSHDILPPERTVKRCESCHSMNSMLMNTLYRHQKTLSREKYGFINGTILSDAYVIGVTRNIYLNIVSIGIFILVIFGILVHASLRAYFSIKRKKLAEKNI